MLELLGQEQACYTALLDLSREQKRLLGEDLLAEAGRLMARKQKVLVRLRGVVKRLKPSKERWRSLRESLGSDERQVLDISLATAEELLAELIASERESEEILCRSLTV
jgi:hypothetical protein